MFPPHPIKGEATKGVLFFVLLFLYFPPPFLFFSSPFPGGVKVGTHVGFFTSLCISTFLFSNREEPRRFSWYLSFFSYMRHAELTLGRLFYPFFFFSLFFFFPPSFARHREGVPHAGSPFFFFLKLSITPLSSFSPPFLSTDRKGWKEALQARCFLFFFLSYVASLFFLLLCLLESRSTRDVRPALFFCLLLFVPSFFFSLQRRLPGGQAGFLFPFLAVSFFSPLELGGEVRRPPPPPFP